MTDAAKVAAKLTETQLVEWIEAQAAASCGAKFMGKPEKWFDDAHWLCVNGHVSGRYLKSEERGSLCLACHEPVFLGPQMGERDFAAVRREYERTKQS